MEVYVIGNVTMDETIAVADLPEIGASIHGSHRWVDLGGKGANQAIVLARCGVTTTLVAPIGDDARAEFIRRELVLEPVSARLITIAGRASDLSIVLTRPDGENAIITTADSAQNLSAENAVAALGRAREGDLVVLQGNLSEATTRGLLEAARGRGMRTALNPSPLQPYFAGLWHLVDIAVLNQGELAALTGAAGEDATRQLRQRGVQEVIVTLGSSGAMLASSEQTLTVPAVPCPVVDTTGAGDTFMAVALASACLRRTRLDRTAIEHAARAAALTVGRVGTRSAFPTAQELSAILGNA